MHRSLSLLRKIVVSLIGFPIIVVGIILVPLPGPGLLIMLLGLGIISLEFAWAKTYVTAIRTRLRAIYDKARQRADALADKNDPPPS